MTDTTAAAFGFEPRLDGRGPSESQFVAACEILTGFVQDPETGWDAARGARVEEQLKAWRLLLEDNRRHAAHDGEKS